MVEIINHNNATGVDMVTGKNYYDAAKHPGGYSASAVTANLENGKTVFEGNNDAQFGFHGLSGNAAKLGIYGTEGSNTSILDTGDLAIHIGNQRNIWWRYSNNNKWIGKWGWQRLAILGVVMGV